jgi:hypothetical protein
MARTRGRALRAKEKKLWRMEGWLQHFCPRELRATHCTQRRVGWDVPACLNRSATGPGYWSRFGDPRRLVPIHTNLFDDADGAFSRPVPQTSAEEKPAAMPLRYRAGR